MNRRTIILIFLGVTAAATYFKFQRRQRAIPYNYQGIAHYQKYALNKPDSILFCGEIVPVKDKMVEDRLNKEMYLVNYYRHNTRILIKRANRWFPKIEPILKMHGIPEDFKYMAVIESSLSNVVSPKGAAGFWQLIPGTGQNMGLTINHEIDERYDPIKSTHAACKYLKIAYKRFGNWTNVAASYNMGMGGMSRQLNAQHQETFYKLSLNKETARYIYKIIAVKEVMENYDKYDFPALKSSHYHEERLKQLHIDSAVVDLRALARENGISLDQIKKYNPWIKGDKLTSEERYVLQIPLSKKQSVEIVEENDSTTIIKISKNKSDEPAPGFDSIIIDSNSQDRTRNIEEGEKNDLYLNSDSGKVAKEL